MIDSPNERDCNRCGQAAAAWLVTARYSPDHVAGRMLSYCDRCRLELGSELAVAMPWTAVDVAPDQVLATLYEQGYTATVPDPDVVAGLGLDSGPWVRSARTVLDEANEPEPDPAECARLHVSESEPTWQRRFRFRQARWRDRQGFPVGHTDAGRPVGNWLDRDFAEATWANFITPHAIARARRELDATKGLMNRSRMLTNLLSSQPLCFNLFAELDVDPDHRLATAWARRLWPDRVERVTAIRFEYSPARGAGTYLDNRSAFDVFLEYEHRAGGRGFVGIEVKYHEDLMCGTENEVRPRARRVAADSRVFADPDAEALAALPLSQMFLDHLLVLSMQQADDWRHGSFLLLYPRGNESCSAVCEQYREQLDAQDTFDAVTLEAAVGHLLAFTRAPWVEALRDRYCPIP